MTEPTTPNTGFYVPNTGDQVGTWGSLSINPDFIAIDGMLGGTQTIALAGPATTVLTLPPRFTGSYFWSYSESERSAGPYRYFDR